MLGVGPAPVVTSVTPSSGTTAGGTSVTIAGSGFQPAATVTFGGAAATNVIVVNATTITATTPAHSAGAVSVVVTNFDTTSGTLVSGFTYGDNPPTAPTGVVATAQASTSVLVTWNAASTATSYQVFRQAPGVAFTQVGTPTGTSFTDTNATADTSYLYRVRAVNAAGASGDSAADIATTVIFSDDPLAAGIVVKAVHLSQLRTAVNAVRVLDGLGAVTFTDTAAAGLVVKAFHITDMRTALDAALGPLGFGTGGYTDPSLTGVVIKALHFQEIRNRVK
jgi:fibronectin type 3 domain-containing protein